MKDRRRTLPGTLALAGMVVEDAGSVRGREEASFLKKRSKKLLLMERAADGPMHH